MSEPINPETIEVSRVPTRDEARAKIFKSQALEHKIVTFRGVDLEVRQPNVGDMIELSKAGTEADRRAFILDILLKYVYIPRTNDLVFEETDLDSIKQLPWNKDMTGVIEAFGDVSGVDFRKNKGGAEEE